MRLENQIRKQVIEVMIISLQARVEASDALEYHIAPIAYESKLARAQIIALEIELRNLQRNIRERVFHG